MNAKIKQLADEAGLRFTQLMSNPMVPVVDGKETDLEKFAELIVRECMELVEGYTKQRTHTTFYKAEEQIKQHFGVEE